jgi:hypothetical protein
LYTRVWSCLSSVAWSCLSSLAHHARLTTSFLSGPAPCLPAHHGGCRRSSWVGCSRQWHHVSRAEIGAQRRQREGLPARACVSPVATTTTPILRITLHYTCAQALSRVSVGCTTRSWNVEITPIAHARWVEGARNGRRRGAGAGRRHMSDGSAEAPTAHLQDTARGRGRQDRLACRDRARDSRDQL